MRDMAKFLFTHNPFYLVSAACVLLGLHLGVQSQDVQDINLYWLLASLSAYTALLAFTAWAVVHFGRVWEDARTLAILVVLLFVAISCSFDQVCLERPVTGLRFMLIGWGFSLATSELLIKGLKVQLPWRFRLPGYTYLALFFLFPALVAYEPISQLGWSIQARVGSFATIAAFIGLGLLPAIRAGRGLFAQNGTPWKWPWYPWIIFGFFAFCVVARSYMLTISFQSDTGWTSTFGPHYLIPFGFSILVLLAEVSFREALPKVRLLALVMPIFLIFASFPFPANASYEAFYTETVATLGSPVWLTLFGSLVFYVWLWLRGERRAEWPIQGLLVGLAIANRVEPRFDLDWHSIPVWPFFAAGAIQCVGILRDWRSYRMVFVACLASIGIGMMAIESVSTTMAAVIAVHGFVLTTGVAAYAFDDRLAVWLRRCFPFAFGLLVIASVVAGRIESQVLTLAQFYTYACLCVVATAVIGWWMRDIRWHAASAICIACLASSIGCDIVHLIQAYLPKSAILALSVGMLCFLLGGLVSAIKAGFLRRWLPAFPETAREIAEPQRDVAQT